MFTIIAGVIGLGIAVALLIVGANYLGNAYTTSAAKAGATALANYGQQVQGAVQLFRVDNNNANPASVAALSPAYLSNAPVFKYGTLVGPISMDTNATVLTVGVATATATDGPVSDSVCGQMANINGEDSTTTLAATSKFGCEGAAGAKVFKYKL